MITPPERSAARDAAIEALLPHAGDLGWNPSALHRAAGPAADVLFPGGTPDIIEAYIDLMDRRMAEAARPLLDNQRLSQRVRTLIATRLALVSANKPAVRRALLVMARPDLAALTARCTARTVDAIWHAAGDNSADFSWYTKRAILTGVYSATLLYAVSEPATEESALAFLDRRLEGVARLMRLRARLTGVRKPVAPVAA
jgi:ubiquinone biosynthesis protein COQ9